MITRPEHSSIDRWSNKSWAFALLLPIVLLMPMRFALAQGDIFGAVRNSDGTVPGPTDLHWWGFLDDTDEEIRIESNTGAGYDGGNWFDNFLNYTTETAGNPYDYYFNNLENGESFHLAGLIPDNSFQQENVVFAPAGHPARPEELAARAVSSTDIRISWVLIPGVTYHVYRRTTSNNGVFCRIDDPTGSLNNPGIADSFYVDLTSDGLSNYTYLIIGEDAPGNYSPHSAEVSVAADNWCDCGFWGDVSGDNDVNPIDVVLMVNFVYKNWDNLAPPPNCPEDAGDISCDGTVNPVDVVLYINYVYKNIQDAWCPDPCF